MVRELHERVNRTDMDRSNTLVIGTKDTQVRETTMSHPARPDLSRRSTAIPPAHLPSGEGRLTWSSGRPCGSVRCPSPGRGAIDGVPNSGKSGYAKVGRRGTLAYAHHHTTVRRDRESEPERFASSCSRLVSGSLSRGRRALQVAM